MKRRRGWWVVIMQDGSQRGHCLRCGEKFGLPLPCNVSIWCAAMRAFVREHENCEEPLTRPSETTAPATALSTDTEPAETRPSHSPEHGQKKP